MFCEKDWWYMKNDKRYEAGRWLSQAKEDLKTVELLVKGGRFYMACFLSQQAAEKFLKAYLYAQGEEMVFGHSISKLCSQCARYSGSFKKLHPAIKNLDQFYIEARYPNGLPDGIPANFFNKNDALRAYHKAKKCIGTVSGILTQ